MIPYRQYRRQVKQNGNYNYETFINELKEYNTFVKKLLPVENESVEKYFRMSMDYYLLESYKRIDFNFKLVDVMDKIGMDEIQNGHFLVKRFHPKVLVLIETDNQLGFDYRVKYYRPLFMVEDKLQKQMQESPNDDGYGIKLISYQIVRAKAYELFRYYYEYKSLDYSDIKQFILQHYNMYEYHDSNWIWKTIEGTEWKKMDIDLKRQLKSVLKKFINVNSALFWESEDRKINLPKE